MKNIYKVLILGLILILATSSFWVGCIGKSKEPDKFVEAMYDLLILEDSSKIETIGLSKEEIKKVITLKQDSWS